MRKTVLDGSNTSGFQRTVLVARDGYVETPSGRVGIAYVYLEEDAARKVSEEKGVKTYRLDRLGLPLVEVVTAPDIKTAAQAKEVALHIGEVLRACKVKRGIGTIRQDINVSISGHPRAEIKGFQDPKVFVDVIDNEISRQLDDLEVGKPLREEVRGANDDNTTRFLRPLPGSARMYPETDLPLLKITKTIIDHAKKTLPKLRSELEADFTKQGLKGEYIKQLFKQDKVEVYREAFFQFPKPNILGELILSLPKELAKRHDKEVSYAQSVIEDHLLDVISLVNKKKIKEKEMKDVFEGLVLGKSLSEAAVIERVDASAIEEDIHNLIKSKPGLSANGYMGLVMKQFKGKVDGGEAMKIIKKFVKK